MFSFLMLHPRSGFAVALSGAHRTHKELLKYLSEAHQLRTKKPTHIFKEPYKILPNSQISIHHILVWMFDNNHTNLAYELKYN